MTLALAWTATRPDRRQHLYVVSDSRIRGGGRLDGCPKIITLPRSDCVLTFAGTTRDAYPLMIQLAYAIGAHAPTRDRAVDLSQLKDHFVRLADDLLGRFVDAGGFGDREVQIILAGYSWMSKEFRVWIIEYRATKKMEERKLRAGFRVRESRGFHPNLPRAALIGDKEHVKSFERVLRKVLEERQRPVHMEPLKLFAEALRQVGPNDSIGGAPQVVQVTEHSNVRPLVVPWAGQRTLFGRDLFEYERVDYWSIDPDTGLHSAPEPFGQPVEQASPVGSPKQVPS